MLDRAAVAAWLNAYVRARETYDSQAIGDLFSEGVTYHYTPYSAPLHGRDAVVAAWLADTYTPGTYRGEYAPLFVAGDRAVAQRRSCYLAEDSETFRTEYDNIFVLRFNGERRCTEYREWYMEKPANPSS